MSPTKSERFTLRADVKCRWHKWFAWHPVKMYDPENDIHFRAWFETVGRRYSICDRYDDHGAWGERIGCVEYCFEEDLIFNALREPDISDKREPGIGGLRRNSKPFTPPSARRIAAVRKKVV